MLIGEKILLSHHEIGVLVDFDDTSLEDAESFDIHSKKH